MDSRESIIQTAIKVFAEKGKYGATMEEVCKLAGYNKAMAYYHFKSKDNLYREVIKTIALFIHGNLNQALKEAIRDNKDHREVVKAVLLANFNIFSRNRDHTRIIIEAMGNGEMETKEAQTMLNEMSSSIHSSRDMINKLMQDGNEKQVFRDIDSNHFLVSMLGMNMIFFMVRPFIYLFGINYVDEGEFIEKHKASIVDLLLNGILKSEIKED